MGVGLPAPVAVVVLSETGQKMAKAEVESSLKATLSSVNHGLEAHERLARLIIVGDEWTTENGLLTPTLKVKRDVLESRYSELISTDYDAPVVWENS